MSDIKLHFDCIAKDYDKWKQRHWYYYFSLKEFYKKVISPGSNVLEIGCGTGEILNSVKPRKGTGLDISENMIEIARSKFSKFEFHACSIEGYSPKEKFDYVIMCDILDHVADIAALFKNIDKVTKRGSKIVITTINPIWSNLLEIAARFRLKMPEGPHNFVLKSDIAKLLDSLSYKVDSQGYFLLLPFCVPIVSQIFNRYLAKAIFLKRLCFVQYIIAVAN